MNFKREEKAIERSKALSTSCYKKIQKEYQVDIAGFGNQLRIKHPRNMGESQKIGIKHLVRYRLNII